MKWKHIKTGFTNNIFWSSQDIILIQRIMDNIFYESEYKRIIMGIPFKKRWCVLLPGIEI